jgi:CubicO group peptidase (beta-lactamase class C family)
LERLKLLFPTLGFRDKFQSCTPAYEIAPLIVERLTGTPFAEYVRREFLEPVGMSDTGHKPSLCTAGGHVPKPAPGGGRWGEGVGVKVAMDKTGTMEGCAGMISSARDLVSQSFPLSSYPVRHILPAKHRREA